MGCVSVALRPQKPSGFLETGSQGRPPRLSHSSSALGFLLPKVVPSHDDGAVARPVDAV